MRVSNHVFRAALLVMSLGLAACASPTPYQPATDGHGYKEQALEDDRYRVTFSGNSSTPRETVENYLLYRAAEVTLERDYDHFVIVERDTERRTTYNSTSHGFGSHHGVYHSGFAYSHAGFHGPFVGFGTSTAWPTDSYTAYANIVMRSGAKPARDEDAYDARAVIERLGPAVSRRPAG